MTVQNQKKSGLFKWSLVAGRGKHGCDEIMELLEEHKDSFYRFILRNVWDTGAAEDVFSHAVLAAIENRHKYTPGTNFRAWMFRILMNKCFVANRETMRSQKSMESPSPDTLAAPAPQEPADVLFGADDIIDQCGHEIYLALRHVSSAQRTCVLLRAIGHFSYQEIAGIMEIPVGTVMTHLARGRKKLREELSDYARKQGIIRPFPLSNLSSTDTDEGEKGSSVTV